MAKMTHAELYAHAVRLGLDPAPNLTIAQLGWAITKWLRMENERIKNAKEAN